MVHLLRADLYRLFHFGWAKVLLLLNGLFAAVLIVIMRVEAFFEGWLCMADATDFHNAVLAALVVNSVLFCPLFVRAGIAGGGTARRIAAGCAKGRAVLSAALSAWIYIAAIYAVQCAVCYLCALSPWCGYGVNSVSAHCLRIAGGLFLALAYCACFTFFSYAMRHSAAALLACALFIFCAWAWYDWFGYVQYAVTQSGFGVPLLPLAVIALQYFLPHGMLATAFGGFGGWALCIAEAALFALLCHGLTVFTVRRREF